MKTEEKGGQTDLILMNTRNKYIETNVHNLKKIYEKKLSYRNKNLVKIKNIYRNQNEKEKYKMSGTQTVSLDDEKNNKSKIKLKTENKQNKNIKRKILFNDIQNLCNNMYNINNYKSNDFKIKLKEDIIKSIDNYVLSDLKKNILFPKEVIKYKINNRTKIEKFKLKKFFQKKEKKEKKEVIEENCQKKEIKMDKIDKIDRDKISMKDILNKYESNSVNDRKIKVYKYNYGDYAKNNSKYNHPQLYTLSNIYRNKNIFPKIKSKESFNSFKDFTKLIPEKITNKKELNKQIYKAYKTMKIKNKNKIGIII